MYQVRAESSNLVKDRIPFEYIKNKSAEHIDAVIALLLMCSFLHSRGRSTVNGARMACWLCVSKKQKAQEVKQ